MKKLFCFLTLFLMVFSANSFAQFEGKIVYNIYETENGEQAEEDQITAYFTPDRILLQAEEEYSMAGSIKAEGLLIRLDKKDFVFLTGETSAMAITKAEITSFINMFGSWSEDEKEEITKSFTFQKAGKSKTINGYEVQKFVYKNKEEDAKGIVWMTQDININWGMLAEPWGDTMRFLTSKDLPMSLIFQEGWMPLKATFYEEGEITGGFTASVTETNLSQTMVQLASKVQIKSLSEYLFDSMRQQQ